MPPAFNPLDNAFHGLAHPTRRAVVERLSQGPATVSELAEPFGMSLPSFMQHLRVLEDSGLISSIKRGRVRTIRIRPTNLRQVAHWIDQQRAIWEKRLDRLDTYVRNLKDHNDRPA